MPRRSGVTIRDVAERAGVSITAVSHALNDKGTLSPATRERVRKAAAELGYRADVVARALRESRMGALGLVIRPLDALGDYLPSGVDYFTRLSGAAAHAAADLGLSLMLVPDLTRSPHSPLALSLDGYIVTDPVIDDPIVTMLLERDLPMVTVGRDPQRAERIPWVATDDTGDTLRMLRTLTAGGAKRIAFVAGTDENSWNLDAIEAYRTWCGENEIEPVLLRVPEAAGEDGGREAAARLWAGDAPEAVYCLTGRHAAGIMRVLRERGLRVPEDVEIAAASDSEHTRSAGITALDMQPSALARAAVTLLDAVTREDPRAAELQGALIEGAVIPRSSTRGTA